MNIVRGIRAFSSALRQRHSARHGFGGANFDGAFSPGLGDLASGGTAGWAQTAYGAQAGWAQTAFGEYYPRSAVVYAAIRQSKFNTDKRLRYSWVVKMSSLGSLAERKERRKSIVSQKMGNCIRSKRRELGLTQKEFAGILGVAKDTVHTWEIGKTLPRRSSLRRIYDCFGLDLTNIVDEYFETRSRESISTKSN